LPLSPAEGGVIGGCADLCNALASKTSPAIGTVCNILCDIVGVEEFIKIIQKWVTRRSAYSILNVLGLFVVLLYVLLVFLNNASEFFVYYHAHMYVCQ